MIPTITFNILTIKGKRHELEVFRQFAQGFDPIYKHGIENFNHLCFNNFIELPYNDAETMIKLEKARYKFWGCGSNAAGLKITDKAHEIRISFSTANSIPKLVLENMVARFPNLKFDLEYRNDRKGVKGVMKVHNGKALFKEVDLFSKEKSDVA